VTRIIAWEKSHQQATLGSNKAIELAGWTGRILTFDGVDRGRPIVIQYVELIRGKVEYALILYATKSLATEGMATFRAMYRTWASTR